MNAKEKAIKFLETKCKGKKVIDDFDYYVTNNISLALDIAIRETKKEMLDIISEYRVKTGCILINESAFALLKKRIDKTK